MFKPGQLTSIIKGLRDTADKKLLTLKYGTPTYSAWFDIWGNLPQLDGDLNTAYSTIRLFSTSLEATKQEKAVYSRWCDKLEKQLFLIETTNERG